jgi:hypothetical protein
VKDLSRSGTGASAVANAKRCQSHVQGPALLARLRCVAITCLAAALWIALAHAARAADPSPSTDACLIGRRLNLASAIIVTHQAERAVTQVLNPLLVQYLVTYEQWGKVSFIEKDDSPQMILDRADGRDGRLSLP